MEALCGARKPRSYPLNVTKKKLDIATQRQAINTAFVLLTLTILPPIFWSHIGSQDPTYLSKQSDQMVPCTGWSRGNACFSYKNNFVYFQHKKSFNYKKKEGILMHF